MNTKQRKALDDICNFILNYTSDEAEQKRMAEAAHDYVMQDHVLANDDEAFADMGCVHAEEFVHEVQEQKVAA